MGGEKNPRSWRRIYWLFHCLSHGVAWRARHLDDRAGILSCANGKAEGFLARDWSDGSPVGRLQQKRFDLHEDVARKLDLPSYRRLSCKGVAVDGTGTNLSGAKLRGLEWSDLGVQGSREMGDESTIAQVLPKQLVDDIWALAAEKGSDFQEVVVDSLCSEGGNLTGAFIDIKVVPADLVVLSMGTRGDIVQQVLPGLQMYGIKNNSALMRTSRVLNEAVFFSGLSDPEVYPRSDGDTYATGFPDGPILVQEVPGQVGGGARRKVRTARAHDARGKLCDGRRGGHH